MNPNGPTPKDQRLAAVAAALARAVVAADVDAADALRIIRHELRRRNTNRALGAPFRSRRAQEVIDRYAQAGEPIPKNSSNDALHCDHVFQVTVDDLYRLHTRDDWLAAIVHLDQVVCVTAAENYHLERIERTGVQGWAKYPKADVEVVEVDGKVVPNSSND
jgi:hypothetical protein